MAAIPPAPPPPPPPRPRWYAPLVASYAASATPRPPASPAPARAGPPSHDAAHRTGVPVAAVDASPDRSHAVLAGKDMLKTVRVAGASIAADTNLRAAVRARDGLGIHDVKWSHGAFSTLIATAAANGKVVLFDLHRPTAELARLHEHSRQVHRLAVNPHQGFLLLSASQDATVRLWDLRDVRRPAAACPSRVAFSGLNGGIRDVRWSPADGVAFAFGTDNGALQRWDYRYPKAAVQRLTAHEQRICTAVDWHPDGRHLLSASVDRTVKVWDTANTSRRPKPVCVLTTPFPVHRARWRPSAWSGEPSAAAAALECTQLVTSYDREHSSVHVWDLRRPHLPFREIAGCASGPSDLLWHSRHTLWTVGKEPGVFQQHDVHLAAKTLDRRSLQALALSPSSQIVGVAQKRPRRRRSSAALPYLEETTSGVESRDMHASPEKARLRSSADDGLDDSFLTSGKRQHGRTPSIRSARSLGGTALPESGSQVVLLSESLAATHQSLKSNQTAFRGQLPGAANPQVFAYLAQKYRPIALTDPPDLDSFLHISRVFDQNAEYAQRAAMHRLAQTWRIVGRCISVATQRRAELHRERRKLRRKSIVSTPFDAQLQESSKHVDGLVKSPQVRVHRQERPAIGTLEPPEHALLALPPDPTSESTSNFPTPLARPVTSTDQAARNTQSPHLLELDQKDIIPLPPAVNEVSRSTHNDRIDASNLLSTPSLSNAGASWYQTIDSFDQRRAQVGSWRASPRIPLDLTPQPAQGSDRPVPPPLERHDSGESFTMFSASSDSQTGVSIPSSFASGASQIDNDRLAVNSWSYDADKSSFGHSQLPTANLQDGRIAEVSPSTIPMDARPIHDKSKASSPQNDFTGFNSGERAVQKMSILRQHNQLLRYDSSESEPNLSMRDHLSVTSPHENADMEASGTIVPEAVDQRQEILTSLSKANERPPQRSDAHEDDSLSLADFQAMHVDAEEHSAFSTIQLLNNLLQFYTKNTPDAQFSSLLLLLLAPLLPQTHTLPETSDIDAGTVLTAFADTFVSLGLTATLAKAVLSTQLNHLIATGLNPYQAESILDTYHTQLHSLSLFNSAATLRRLAYPTYPAVYEQALSNVQVGLLCLSCNSPINNPTDKMRCESCRRAQAPCPICWETFPAFTVTSAKSQKKHSSALHIDAKAMSCEYALQHRETGAADASASPASSLPWTPPRAILWTWCMLCGHGGHTTCMSTWYADTGSDGACPTEGCTCDCTPGARRDERLQEALQRNATKERARVVRRGDDWRVRESRAVAAVRGMEGEASSN